jgi:hypothetical protein
MSTYIEYSGTVILTPDTTMAAIVQAIRNAIGEQDQETYFAIGDVLEPAADLNLAASIDFRSIPPEGASSNVIEAAMLAIAPFVDGNNSIEMVPGMNWSSAAIYRFNEEGRVEVSDAELTPTGNWRLIEPQKTS